LNLNFSWPMLKKYFSFFIFLFFSLNIFAQTSNTGTNFWCGFMGNFSGATEFRLYFSASDATMVKIRVPLKNYIDSIFVPKDSVRVFKLTALLANNQTNNVISEFGINIISDFPITVASMNLQFATTDASIVLPTSNIPRNPIYYSVNPNTGLNSTILLVSPEDSVKIKITPTKNLAGGQLANTAFFITLNEAETYQIRIANDLSGSKIEVVNNKKLIAFSGDQCSNFPCGACDHQYEQILPDEVLDTAYLVSPHYGHTRGYVTKIVPLDTSTNIKINGVMYNNISYKTPLTIFVSSGDTSQYISSTKKFRCYQFLKGAVGCNGYYNSSYGDPAFVCKVGAKSFGQTSLFSTVNSNNLRDHYVNVIINTASKGRVFHNGLRIDSTEFIEFLFNKKFSYAKLILNLGSHKIECIDGHLAYSYGVGFFESYLYLAGFSLPNFDLTFKDSVMAYNCKDTEFLYQFRAKFSAPVKKIVWNFGDGNFGTGNPVTHNYLKKGIYIIKLVGTDFNGKKDSMTRTINIDFPTFNPLKDLFSCGDTILIEERNPFFANFKWQDSSTNKSYRAFGSSKKLWVAATDTSGYCKFEDNSNYYKTEILTTVSIDIIDSCFKNNLFILKDNFKITNGNFVTKVWTIPNVGTWFNQNDVNVKFSMPGTYPVYYDIITEKCKLREKKVIVVHPNTRVFGKPVNEAYCENTPINFSDNSTIFGGKIKKIIWSFDDGATKMESDSLKITAPLAYKNQITRKFFHISVTDQNCFDTFKNQILISPSPKPAFTTNIDTQQCLPNARWTFNSTTTSVDDTAFLNWDLGNGRKGISLQMRNIRYTSAGEYKIKLKAENNFGCKDSAIKYVQVYDIPKANFTSFDSIQCLENNKFIFNNQTNGNNFSFKWYGNNALFSVNKNGDSVSFSQKGNYKIKLIVSAPIKGCDDSLERTVFVKGMPIAMFSTLNKEQCLSNNLFNFTNQSTFENTGIKSAWNINGNNYFNHDLNQFKFSTVGFQKIELKVIDSLGCTAQFTDSVKITDNITANLDINNDKQCFSNQSFILKLNNTKKDTISWILNRKFLQKNTTDSIEFQSLNVGKYLVNILGVNSSTCIISDSISFEVVANPKANFNINKDTQCYANHQFIFTNSSLLFNSNNDKANYEIENKLYNESNLTHQFNAVGSYLVKFTVQNKDNCSDTVSKLVVLVTTPQATIYPDSICLGQAIKIDAEIIHNRPISFWEWRLSNGSNYTNKPPFSIPNLSAGTFDINLKIKDDLGCETDTMLKNGVKVFDLPNSDFSINQTGNQAIKYLLQFSPNLINPNNQYLWNLPNGSISNMDSFTEVFYEILKGKVFLTITDINNCKNTSEKAVSFYANKFNFYMPSAFTPNQDDANEIIIPIGIKDINNYSYSIYNRWGQRVFETHNLQEGWNGKYQNNFVMEGNYFYDINFKYLDGKSYQFRGVITLLK